MKRGFMNKTWSDDSVNNENIDTDIIESKIVNVAKKQRKKKLIILTTVLSVSAVTAGIVALALVKSCSHQENTTNQLNSSKDYFVWNGTEITGLTEAGKKQKSLVIPSECTEIANGLFLGNKKIEHIDLSNTSITKLKQGIFIGSFSGASNLKTVKLPKTLKTIEGYTFAGCNPLTNIEFPEELTNIGPFAFAECRLLTNIKIPKLIKNLPQNVFYNCSSLISVQLPEGLKIIDMEVFKGCVNLESINIPDSITKIVLSAFEDCNNPNLRLYCASEETRQRVSSMTLTSIKKEQIVLKTN